MRIATFDVNGVNGRLDVGIDCRTLFCDRFLEDLLFVARQSEEEAERRSVADFEVHDAWDEAGRGVSALRPVRVPSPEAVRLADLAACSKKLHAEVRATLDRLEAEQLMRWRSNEI